MFPATERLSSTARNLPKPPTGWSMAAKRPPMFPPAYPCSQDGTDGTATTTAAPKHSKTTYIKCKRSEVYIREKTHNRYQEAYEGVPEYPPPIKV